MEERGNGWWSQDRDIVIEVVSSFYPSSSFSLPLINLTNQVIR